jgi:hypothetical protein
MRRTFTGKGETGSTKRGEQEANHSGEEPCAFFPGSAGIESGLPLLVEWLRGHDRAQSALSPGGNGGTRDVDVLGNGRDATPNDVFAQAVVVGAPSVRLGRDRGSHPGRIFFASGNLNDIEGAALANRKFRMSSHAARLT